MNNSKKIKSDDANSYKKNITAQRIIYVLVALIVIIMVVWMMTVLRGNYSSLTYRAYDATTIFRYLDNGDYVNAVKEYRKNESYGVTAERYPAYTEVYAACGYWEARFDDVAYIAAGDDEMHNKMQDVMKKCREDAGDMEFILDEMDEYFDDM